MSKKKTDTEANSADESFLLLAAHFRHMHDTAPEMFSMMAKAEGVSVRKAYYLAGIDRTFSKLGVPRARLSAIGWTKLQMMCDHISEANCEELLTAAENTTVREFSLWLRGAEAVDGTRCVLMYFTPEQYEVFETAVLKQGSIKCGRGLVGKEEALIKVLGSTAT